MPVHSIVLGVLCALPWPQEGPPAATEGTLEGFLERTRAEQRELLERLRPTLERLVARLEATPPPGAEKLAAIHAELAQLGPEAGLLLVEYLDPGVTATAAERFRAATLRDALERMRPPGIVGALVERSGEGSLEGRGHAIALLGHVPERARASAHLRRLYRDAPPELRLESIRSLAQQGSAESTAILQTALGDEDDQVRRTVLAALTEGAQLESGPAVLALLGSPKLATPVAGEILAYYRALPELVDAAVVEALLGLAMQATDRPEACAALLEGLPDFEAAQDVRDLRKRVAPLTEGQSPEVRDAALVCAVRLGDRRAKKTLLASYDQRIEEEPSYYKFYEQRGEMLLRIDDAGSAARDFRRAIELLDGSNEPRYHELWINLARAYMRTRKLTRARDVLEEMQMTFPEREALRADPDFQELVNHPRYGKLFE